jgi:hypothetical protein
MKDDFDDDVMGLPDVEIAGGSEPDFEPTGDVDDLEMDTSPVPTGRPSGGARAHAASTPRTAAPPPEAAARKPTAGAAKPAGRKAAKKPSLARRKAGKKAAGRKVGARKGAARKAAAGKGARKARKRA